MRVAGLDIATTTGLAILEGDKLLFWQAHRSQGRTEGHVFCDFEDWLTAVLREWDVGHVGFEESLPTNIIAKRAVVDKRGRESVQAFNPVTNSTYQRLHGLRAIAQKVCARREITVDAIHQSTWRKAFLGTGRPAGDTKVAALERCRVLGWDVKSKDAAEACGVAFCAQGRLGFGSLFQAAE